MEFDDLSKRVIGCAIEVHRALGPGMLEAAYGQCLAHELTLREITFEAQYPMPVEYKGIRLECRFRAGFLIENTLILELKSIEQTESVHEAQLLT